MVIGILFAGDVVGLFETDALAATNNATTPRSGVIFLATDGSGAKCPVFGFKWARCTYRWRSYGPSQRQ